MTEKQYTYLFIAGMLLVSVLFSKCGYEQIRDGRESLGWPATEGVITSSKVQLISVDDEDATYAFNVLYDYEVSGTPYQGTRTKASNITAIYPARLSKYLEKYPVDSKVSVYYNPDNPAESLLETGIYWRSYLALFVGLVIFGVAVWLLVEELRGS